MLEFLNSKMNHFKSYLESRKFIEEACQRFQRTIPEMECLTYVAERDGKRSQLREVYDYFGVDINNANVRRTIKSLFKQNLLHVSLNRENSRTRSLILTSAGKKLYENFTAYVSRD